MPYNKYLPCSKSVSLLVLSEGMPKSGLYPKSVPSFVFSKSVSALSALCRSHKNRYKEVLSFGRI